VRARNSGVDEGQAAVGSEVGAVAETPLLVGPEPPDTFRLLGIFDEKQFPVFKIVFRGRRIDGGIVSVEVLVDAGDLKRPVAGQWVVVTNVAVCSLNPF